MGAPIIKPKKGRGRKKAKKPVMKSKDSLGSPCTGHVERLHAFQKRAFDLKVLDMAHWEIAEKIAEEFNLERVPSVVTIANWLDKANFAFELDIAKLAAQMRIEQFNELERLKQKWMPLACAQELAIKRWIRVEGTLQPDLDENAVAEQIDATKAVVAIMARQAKLLGLDMDKKIEGNKDELDLNTLQLWIIGQVNGSPDVTQALTFDVEATSSPSTGKPTGPVLELRSGRDDIDEFELGSTGGI